MKDKHTNNRIADDFFKLPAHVRDLALGCHYLYEAGLFDLAILYFTKVIDDSPEDVDALVYRAKAYMYSNNYTSAIADLTEILEQAPENANTLFERGVCFYRLRVWDRAIWDFSSAIEYLAAPNKELEATLYYNRGISYLGAGRYEEAEKDLTHSRFLNEHHAETFIKLAEARVHLGKVEFAKRDLQGLLEQQPNHIEAFSLLAQLNASPVEGT